MKFASFVIFTFATFVAVANGMFNSENSRHMPYHAYVTFSSPQMTFYGGGALISNIHVLTSGANTQGFTTWRIGLGSNRRSQHTTVTTNRGVAHPNYSGANNIRVNDIGIIFLLQPVIFSATIFPIFLPPNQETSEVQPFLNEQGMVLGFAGSTSAGQEGLENLQAAHVRAMEFSACLPHYGGADGNQHFCANDPEAGSNFCLGDQGGMLTVMNRDQEFIAGIATLPGCSTIPSLYTRIGPYREWIFTQTGL